MACIRRYKTIKIQSDNNYLMDSDMYPQTVVEAKRLLADYIVPQHSSGGDNICTEDDGSGVAFTKARAEYIKNAQCYGCGRKGHLLYNCTGTSAKKEEEILAMVESGDFKTSK